MAQLENSEFIHENNFQMTDHLLENWLMISNWLNGNWLICLSIQPYPIYYGYYLDIKWPLQDNIVRLSSTLKGSGSLNQTNF